MVGLEGSRWADESFKQAANNHNNQQHNRRSNHNHTNNRNSSSSNTPPSSNTSTSNSTPQNTPSHSQTSNSPRDIPSQHSNSKDPNFDFSFKSFGHQTNDDDVDDYTDGDKDGPLPLQYGEPFAGWRLIAALKKGYTIESIKEYLQYFTDEEIKEGTKDPNFVFQLVRQNNVELLQILLREEAVDVKAKNIRGISVLAHAIMFSKISEKNVIEVVRTLLAHGADPESIPRDMWINYVDAPKAMPLPIGNEKPWTEKRRRVLAETLTLSIRYSLYRAHRAPKMSARTKQMATEHKVTALFGIPNMIIGQEYAAEKVVETIFARIAWNPDKKEQRPLVICFAGLSGHGKTELASHLGSLLGVDMVTIDFTQVQSVMQLFGTPVGYHGNATGSPLNNFLREHDGKRSVVFLDEYDKTTDPEVTQSLLKVMESGEYLERGGNNPVCCRETIWILAANAGAEEIQSFYNIKKMATRKDVDISPLEAGLKQIFIRKFTPAVCGRISLFVPFFPFNIDEQAVIAHKFFLKKLDQLRRSIDTNAPALRFVGRSTISMVDDGKICKLLAQDGFDEETGARSLINRIDNFVIDFIKLYRETDVLVANEMNDRPMGRYLVKAVRMDGGGEKIVVVHDRRAVDKT